MKTIIGSVFGGCAFGGWIAALITSNDLLAVASGLMAIAFAVAHHKEP